MILLTNTTAQTLAPGQIINFDSVLLHTGCGEYHRNNTGTVKMKFDGVYVIGFSGNIGVPADGTGSVPVQLSIAVDGAPLPETVMQITPANVDRLWNVAKETLYANGDRRCCCGDDAHGTVSVMNTGTIALDLGPGAALWLRRES